MTTVNEHTKIGAILRESPAALDAIVSLSPHFEKLRNPVLRKLMANRTSIAMAAKLGGCKPLDFFQVLAPLGFSCDDRPQQQKPDLKPIPEFIKQLDTLQVQELDVRPVIDAGNDPLKLILDHISSLPAGAVLKIINHFEPTPLIQLLGKKGIQAYVDPAAENRVDTYFYKQQQNGAELTPTVESASDWHAVLQRYEGNFETIDVREMPAPWPMHSILNAVDSLPKGKALYVFHKRIPVFLLPELASRDFAFRVREVGPGEVHLLIYHQ